MNTIVKKIAAAATAFALAAAVTLSATDAPATIDLAAAGVDMAAADYAVDMGADFAAENNTQTAFFWLFLLGLMALISAGITAVSITGAATGWT